jgi:hypothetical protein
MATDRQERWINSSDLVSKQFGCLQRQPTADRLRGPVSAQLHSDFSITLA